MNESKYSKSALIRIILSAIALITVILGIVDIVPSKISLPIAVAFLSASTIWSGIDAIKNKRIKSAVFNFVLVGVLIILTLASILL